MENSGAGVSCASCPARAAAKLSTDSDIGRRVSNTGCGAYSTTIYDLPMIESSTRNAIFGVPVASARL